MLTLILPPKDDDFAAVVLRFEHSLVSLSKWEAIHEKTFFGGEPKTNEETLSYIEQMLLTEDSPENFLERIASKDIIKVNEYINSKQTATFFREEPGSSRSRDVITNELIYYWMIQFQIPFDPCQNWHLNRLMTLIKICGIKQTKPKRMSRQAIGEQYRNLNAQRRRDLGTSG